MPSPPARKSGVSAVALSAFIPEINAFLPMRGRDQGDGSSLPLGNAPSSLLLDYDVRTDSNPVFFGKAAPGVAAASVTWTVFKFAYDGSNRLVTSDVRSPVSWTNRADPTLDGLTAWTF